MNHPHFKSRFGTFFGIHKVALLFALIVSFIYGCQHIFLNYFINEAGQNYYPIIVKGHFDEGYYAIRAANAFRGNLLVGDPIIKENSGLPAALPILNPILLASLGWLTGSFENGVIVSDFIFPALIFILVYLTAFELTRRRIASLVFAAVFIVAPKFGLWPSSGVLPFFSEPRELFFARLDYPSLTFTFFAAALYFLIRLARRPSPRAGIYFGAVLGVTFYTYFFDWVYLVLVAGFLFAGAAIFKLPKISRALLVAAPAAMIVSAFYWRNFLSLMDLPAYSDVVERIGVERGRHFRLAVVWFSYVRAILFASLMWVLFKLRDKIKFLYGVALVLPIVILLNVQVVTGFAPQPDHWQRVTFLGFALVSWIILLWLFDKATIFLEYRSFSKKIAAIFVSFAIFGFALCNQYFLARDSFFAYVIDPAYGHAYDWISLNLGQDDVIVALSPLTSDEIVLKTGRYVFLPNGFLSLSSTEEIWDRLSATGWISGLSSEKWESYAVFHTTHLFADQYGTKDFNSYFGDFERRVPCEILAVRRDEYESFSIGDILDKFRLNYILIGPRERELGAIEPAAVPSRKVYEESEVAIYEI